MNQNYQKALIKSWEAYAAAFEIIGEEPNEAFKWVFKQAYALGKQTETITQEEIEKAAEEYVRNNPFTHPYTVIATRESYKDGICFALGKQEKDADTVISGWVARDKGGFISLFSYCPDRVIHDDLGFWGHNDGSDEIDLPKDSFPDLTWDSEPLEVEIIIKRKKK